MLPNWDFDVIDANGRSGGLASGWRLRVCRCENLLSISSGLGLEVFVPDLGKILTILNVYGPYQDRVPFWDKVFNNPMLDGRDLILGGDLNFSLALAEVWGPRVVLDVLLNYFLNGLVQKEWLDINPVKVTPTWRNTR